MTRLRSNDDPHVKQNEIMIVENHGAMSQGSNNEGHIITEQSRTDHQVAGRIEPFSFQKSPGL